MATQLSPDKDIYWETFSLAHGPLRGYTLEQIANTIVGILHLYRLGYGICCFWVKDFERQAIRRFFAMPRWEQALRAALDARAYHQKP